MCRTTGSGCAHRAGAWRTPDPGVVVRRIGWTCARSGRGQVSRCGGRADRRSALAIARSAVPAVAPDVRRLRDFRMGWKRNYCRAGRLPVRRASSRVPCWDTLCWGVAWGLLAADTSLSWEVGTRRPSEDTRLPLWRKHV
jgi:hypothetical protein